MFKERRTVIIHLIHWQIILERMNLMQGILVLQLSIWAEFILNWALNYRFTDLRNFITCFAFGSREGTRFVQWITFQILSLMESWKIRITCLILKASSLIKVLLSHWSHFTISILINLSETLISFIIIIRGNVLI